MEDLFSKLAIHTATFVGKAAFGAASKVVLSQISTFISSPSNITSSNARDEIKSLHNQLSLKFSVVSPAIDMCELIAARGYSHLHSILDLVSPIRKDMLRFSEEIITKQSGDVGEIKDYIQNLIHRVDGLIPYVNLALTMTNGGSSFTPKEHFYSTFNIDAGISLNRLLLASKYLNDISSITSSWCAIGPSFEVTVYKLFTSSSRAKGYSDWTWKEEFHRCQCNIVRLKNDEKNNALNTLPYKKFVYHIHLVQNLKDGRYHEEKDIESPVNTKKEKGISTNEDEHRGIKTQFDNQEDDDFLGGDCLCLPIEAIQKSFYSRSGTLLNISDAKTPVLVLKTCRQRMFSSGTFRCEEVDDQSNNCLEYYALEIFQNLGWDSDVEDESSETNCSDDFDDSKCEGDTDEKEVQDINGCNVETKPEEAANEKSKSLNANANRAIPDLSQLSLLEYLLRLSSVESSEQCSHLTVHDEKLQLYLANDLVTPRERKVKKNTSSHFTYAGLDSTPSRIPKTSSVVSSKARTLRLS